MIVKRVARIDPDADGITLVFETDAGSLASVTMPGDIVAAFIDRLAGAANQMDRPPYQTYKQTHSVVECRPMTTSHGHRGVVFQTREGLNIPLVMAPSSRSALRRCIEQIDREESDQTTH